MLTTLEQKHRTKCWTRQTDCVSPCSPTTPSVTLKKHMWEYHVGPVRPSVFPPWLPKHATFSPVCRGVSSQLYYISLYATLLRHFYIIPPHSKCRECRIRRVTPTQHVMTQNLCNSCYMLLHSHFHLHYVILFFYLFPTSDQQVHQVPKIWNTYI